MKGDGYYDDHSAPQMAAIAAVLPWLSEAVSSMNLETLSGPFVIADFACSEGRNSIAATRPIVAALRARDQRPIQTVHSDLPTNNFNQLFANLFPGGQRVFAESDVYSAAVTGSMYDQLLPANTVSVATTYNAIGFLNERPAAPVPNFILPMGPGRPRPGVDISPEARESFAAQAHADLVRFYTARAAELMPGGKLLVATFGANEQYRACDGIYDVLNDALLDLVAAGRLGPASYERLLFPIYFRTSEELVAPIVGVNSGLSELFRLDRVDSMEVVVPFNERLDRTGDVAAYAREFAQFMRAFTEPIILMALADQSDRDFVIDDLYPQVESRLARDPGFYPFHYIQVAALLTRR
jgi:hypothetical protein